VSITTFYLRIWRGCNVYAGAALPGRIVGPLCTRKEYRHEPSAYQVGFTTRLAGWISNSLPHSMHGFNRCLIGKTRSATCLVQNAKRPRQLPKLWACCSQPLCGTIWISWKTVRRSAGTARVDVCAITILKCSKPSAWSHSVWKRSFADLGR